MRICVVAYKFGTEEEIGRHLGTYHYFIEILRRLVKAGHEVEVIAPWLSFIHPGSKTVDGIKIIRYFPPLWHKIWAFPLSRILRWWYLGATKRQVLSFDKKYKPDVYLVWQARETGFALAQIKDQLSAPLIFRQITTWQWHFERSVEEIFGRRRIYQLFKKLKLKGVIDWFLEKMVDQSTERKYADLIYKKSDKVVFVSEIAAKEARTMGLIPEKIGILPVAIDFELFKPLNEKNQLRQILGLLGQKIILFVGRINFAEKGIGYLLAALPEVKKMVPDVNLVIVGGGGEEERLKSEIKKLDLESTVQLVGKKPFEDLVKYINACDVFVVPSVWLETFGQVTIEAMSCGVPVVTFDAGASPYINLDGQTGFVVPSKDVLGLSQAISKLLLDSSLATRLGQAGRLRVEQNYTYEIVVAKLLNLITELKHDLKK